MLMLLLANLEDETDRRRFAALYAKYHERMERAALRILASQADAEDAMQNACVQVIRHFDQTYKMPEEELAYWLLAIVKNEALMLLRKAQRSIPTEDFSAFEQEAENVTDYRALVECFAKLPETYRATLEMKLLLGYSDAEIAKRLGISETAVSTRANRGRALLRKIVESEGFHHD